MANHTSRLQQWLESIWYDSENNQSFGRLLLMPISYLYSAVNNYQRKTYSKNQIKIKCPVLVVGNITAGGTGKTPLTIHIVELLQKSGYKAAIITRGYGGKAISWPQSVTADSSASLVGDEAVLMAQRTGVPVYAGADRLASVDAILKSHDCDVIVSDDGMQHYKLARDIQIAVIDGNRQLGNGYCLPAGPLREKKDRLKNCDFIVVNGINSKVDPYLGSDYFEMGLSATTLVNLSTAEEKPLSDFDGKQVQALTGIGNPQRFYSTLEAQGIKVVEHSYPDHYAFTESDLNFSADSIVIMTEKDAVKCKTLIANKNQFWYLPISAQLTEDFDITLLDKFKNVVTDKRRN